MSPEAQVLGEVQVESWEKMHPSDCLLAFPPKCPVYLQLIKSKIYLLQSYPSQKWQLHISRCSGEKRGSILALLALSYPPPVSRSSSGLYLQNRPEPFSLHPLPTLVPGPDGFIAPLPTVHSPQMT